MSDQVPVYPKKSPEDYIHDLLKFGLSCASGPGGELFSTAFPSPIVEKQKKWMSELIGKINKVIDDIDCLKNNMVFMSAIITALQTVAKTNKQEKLDALKNALVNIAKGDFPEEDLNTVFFSAIDSFSSWHLLALKIEDNPKEWFELNEIPFPISDNSGFFSRELFLGKAGIIDVNQGYDVESVLKKIVADLILGGFIQESVVGAIGELHNKPQTTIFGKDFLRFIKDSDSTK